MPKGDRSRTLTPSQVFAAYHSTEALAAVARRLGVSKVAIHYIRTGKTWSHVTGAAKRKKALPAPGKTTPEGP